MNTGGRRAMTGSIHKIREFELEKVSVLIKAMLYCKEIFIPTYEYRFCYR